MIPSPNLKHMNKRKILLSQTSGKKGVSERKPLRNNDKIRSLIKDLYKQQMPEESEKHEEMPKKNISQKHPPKKSSHQVAKYFLQNQVAMRNAQKELNQRVKNRILLKSKRVSSQFGESYLKQYQKYKKFMKDNKLFDLAPMQQTQKSPEGIMYFQFLKQMPGIMQYTLEKKKRIEKQQNQELGKGKQLENLKFLRKRKKHQSELLLQMSGKATQWEKEDYFHSMSHIGKISDRIKKIYSRKPKTEMDEKTREVLKSSRLLKTQQGILQQIDDLEEKGRPQMARDNKLNLIDKFSSIVHELGKSIPPKRVRQNQMLTSRLQSSRISTMVMLQQNSFSKFSS